MMKRFVTVAALVSLMGTAIPQTADAFTGKGRTRINPVNDAVFEVIPRGSSGSSSYWCGASDYARRALKAGWKTRIYIARGLGQSVTTGRKSAVQFTLDPKAAGITPIEPQISLNALKVGDNMTVQKANTYCSSGPLDF